MRKEKEILKSLVSDFEMKHIKSSWLSKGRSLSFIVMILFTLPGTGLCRCLTFHFTNPEDLKKCVNDAENTGKCLSYSIFEKKLITEKRFDVEEN